MPGTPPITYTSTDTNVITTLPTAGTLTAGVGSSVATAGNPGPADVDVKVDNETISFSFSVEDVVVNDTPPVVSGIRRVGQTLSTTDGTWTGYPAASSYDYQWQVSDDGIAAGPIFRRLRTARTS